MKIKFHHILAFFIGTLFVDFDWSIGTVKIRIIDIFSVLLLIAMVLSSKPFSMIFNKVTSAFYAFLVFIVINGVFKISLPTVVKVVVQLSEYIFVMHLIANETADPKKRKEFLNIIFWMAGCVAFYSMCYHISIGRFSDFKDLDAPKHSFAYFALLGLIRFFTESKNKRANLFILLFGLFMLLLSGERKGWAGAFIGSSVFIYLQLRYTRSTRSYKSFLALLIAIIISAVFGISAMFSSDKFDYITRQFGTFSSIATNISKSSSSIEDTKSDIERLYLLNYGIALFFKNPFFGIGIEQFQSYAVKASHGGIDHDAHNFYLKILDEEGAVGLLLFLTFAFVLYLSILKLTRNRDPNIALSARILITIFFLGAIVDFFLASKAISWFYYFVPCGMLIGIRRQLAAQREIEEDELEAGNEEAEEEDKEEEEDEETASRVILN